MTANPSQVSEPSWKHDLEEAAHVLPNQGPIDVFIHHNTLHAYQSLPFHEAVARAEDELGIKGYLSEAQFRAAYDEGRIAPEDLEWALGRFPPTPEEENLTVSPRALQRAMMLGTPAPMSRDTLEFLKAEGRWASHLDRALEGSVRAQLISETVAWLDEALREGPSLMPFARRLLGPRVDVLTAQLQRKGAHAEAAEAESLRRLFSPLDLPMHRPSLTQALQHQAERLTAFSLWGACVDLAGGTDVLAPAKEDAVEREAAHLINTFLIPLCAAFLDRGVARWTMPQRETGFFATFRALYQDSGLPLPDWLDGLSAILKESASRKQTAEDVVAELPASTRAQTLKRMLLQLPGWAGMFQRVETFPVPELPGTRLVDYVAVRIKLEPMARAAAAHRAPESKSARTTLVRESVLGLYAAAQRLGLSARSLHDLPMKARMALLGAVERFDLRARSQVWQEAYERQHAREVVGALIAPRPVQTPPPVSLQAVFCIDDREESYRRHLEEVLPSVRTFGVAGFFGVAIEFLPHDDVASMALAPLGLVPGHTIVEKPHAEDEQKAKARKARKGAWARLNALWHGATRGVPGGGLASFAMGPFALLELTGRVLAPRATARAIDSIGRTLIPEVRTVLAEERSEDESRSLDGRFLGFTFAEKAQRVAATLENIGLTRDFAPLVFIIAHGSSSTNNPHRSAYDCGACGGRNGGPNARLFARMANRPQVRQVLRERGIHIPDTTHFVGAVHDTATDYVTIYDVEAIPSALQGDLLQARKTLEEVSRRSAHERCRRFASAPRKATVEEALRHVEARAADVSQARPELGHATNAVCVIGRRNLTRGLFLDRRSFLISYDPTQDPAGAVIERILAAAGPVGAGINLEYYFSRVDNERLGAGTKLPHNITGHLGVMNGASSDLRTGLPRQMIEIHEPVRLLMIIEAETETLAAAVSRQPVVQELAFNGWVRIVTVSPSGKGAFTLRDGAFVPWDAPAPQLPRMPDSRSWYEGHEGFRPPAVILTNSRDPAHVV